MINEKVEISRVRQFLLGPFLVLLGGICIGYAPIGIRWGLEDLGPQGIAFWRYFFALPILYSLLCFGARRRPARPNKGVILAALFFSLDIAIWHWALDVTSVANATFLVNLGSIMVGFLAWIFLKERPAPIWFAAVFIAIAGAAALSFGGGASGVSVLRGDLLALLAAVFVAGYILCSKVARGSLPGLDTIFWLTAFEFLFEAVILALSGEPVLPAGFPADLSGFVSPFSLAIIVQIAGQGMIVTGLGRTPVAAAGLIVIIQPVVAAALAWKIFNESLAQGQLLGAACILLAIFVSQLALEKRQV